MDILRHVLLFLHLAGMAALVGGLLTQFSSANPKITGLIRDGAGTAFLAGIGLVGLLEATDQSPNHGKVGVKLLIGLVILVLAMMNLRKESISKGIYFTLLGLTFLNLAVAVFWASPHLQH